METEIHRMVAACQEGTYDAVIGKLPSGWAVLGTTQVLRGYCLLLPDPVVGQLNDLVGPARIQFLIDMALLGDIVMGVTGAARINYAMFGNLEPALHAHVFPRFADEPDELRTSHPWLYDWSQAPAFDINKDANLQMLLQERLARSLTRE